MSEALSMRPVDARHVSSIWKLSTSDFCTITEHLLRQSQYWATEAVLKVFFFADPSTSKQSTLSNEQLQEAWISIQWFVEGPLEDEEQEMWARIAILQTFCEGLLALCRPAATHGVACDWYFPKVIQLLRDLFHEAISRDKRGDWLHSRTSIRNQLLEFDNEVANDAERGDIVWSTTMFDTLLQLCEDAEDNKDLMMDSSVHWRLQTLGFEEGPRATADPGLIPLKVYARWESVLAEMKDSKYSRRSGRSREWWPSPTRLIRIAERESHGHEGMSTNEQGSPEGPSQEEEAIRAESVHLQDSTTETPLAPAENLWALLGGEREANRDLQQEVQRLKRSVVELTAARDSNPSQSNLAMMLEGEREANRDLQLRLNRSNLVAANKHLDTGSMGSKFITKPNTQCVPKPSQNAAGQFL